MPADRPNLELITESPLAAPPGALRPSCEQARTGATTQGPGTPASSSNQSSLSLQPSDPIWHQVNGIFGFCTRLQLVSLCSCCSALFTPPNLHPSVPFSICLQEIPLLPHAEKLRTGALCLCRPEHSMQNSHLSVNLFSVNLEQEVILVHQYLQHLEYLEA